MFNLVKVYSLKRYYFHIVSIVFLNFVAGCSSLPQSLDKFSSMSIAGTSEIAAIPSDVYLKDVESINTLISESFTSLPIGSSLEWSSDSTGSNGSIAPSSGVRFEESRSCRQFTTTIHMVTGIERYYGNACKNEHTAWKIDSLQPYGNTPPS